MTKYNYSCEEDKNLIKRSYDNIAYLIFGKNAQQKINMFTNYFSKRVSEINIYPQGSVTAHLSDKTPGICRADKDRNIIIEMLGYKGASKEKYSWIQHEGTHEFCHAFVDLLPEIFGEKPNGIVKNGILCKNQMGLIKQSDPITGELVGHHFYGKMFNETSMDIMSSMAINSFDSNVKGTTVDNILRRNYNYWGNEETIYSIFTSITRLTIAAFSNNGFINYQNLVDKGVGIFDINTIMLNGERYKANDFLYGIVFDPLHIEKEFDKFMGEGYYKLFCESLDKLFIFSLENQEISNEVVKTIMNILPKFINRKINYYKEKGIINLAGANKIISNFNEIWNSMQSEYKAYFSQKDIEAIYRKSNEINDFY